MKNKVFAIFCFLVLVLVIQAGCVKRSIEPSFVQKDSLFINGSADLVSFNYLISDSTLRGLSTYKVIGDSIKKFTFTMAASPDTSIKYLSISIIANIKKGPASIDSIFKTTDYVYADNPNAATGRNAILSVEIEWFSGGVTYSSTNILQNSVFTITDVKDLIKNNLKYKEIWFNTNCIVQEFNRPRGITLKNISGKIVFIDS